MENPSVYRSYRFAWRWFGLVTAALALTSCATLLGRPQKGITIREQVKVCFQQSEHAHILASVVPAECYSMRCYRVTMATGTVVLDRREYRLAFEPLFNLQETRSLLPCTPDCAGGGNLASDLGQLEPGRYQVFVWEEYLGDLDVASGLPWRDQCLSTGAAQG